MVCFKAVFHKFQLVHTLSQIILHKLHKLFNRNNVKLSYSCLPNIKSIINSHNRKKLHPSSIISKGSCNCINQPLYPLNQKCYGNSNLYQVKITKKIINSRPTPPFRPLIPNIPAKKSFLAWPAKKNSLQLFYRLSFLSIVLTPHRQWYIYFPSIQIQIKVKAQAQGVGRDFWESQFFTKRNKNKKTGAMQ